MEKSSVISQRLFANWEPDRTGTSIVQRVVTLNVNRILIAVPTQPGTPLVLTAKLQGFKRTLRSNEIPAQLGGPTVDVDLDVSFNIQYPHFLKHKLNILQIMVQRKRKYKNRPIPGGFKTLATGTINLSQLLQQGRLREILLWSADDSEKELGNGQSVGKIFLSSCHTSPLDTEDHRLNKKPGVQEQEGESEDDSDSEYDDAAIDDLNEPSSAGVPVRSLEHVKMARRKNFKQKLVNLLKKFKDPEDEAGMSSSRAASVVGAPTAKELEALFEELEDMSDSDPPEVAPDDVSIGSNPRPALRPYFTRSKEILPAIFDQETLSDTDNDADELEFSSEDNAKEANPRLPDNAAKEATTASVTRTQLRVGSTCSAPLSNNSGLLTIPHSQTTGSINKKEHKSAEPPRHTSVSEQMLLMDDNSRPVRVWLCSPEATHLSTLPLPILFCSGPSAAKHTLSQVVTRIQNFCNSNSANPPITYVGIIGGDKLVSQVLKAYVDCFHLKSSSGCMQFLRFVVIPSPQSLVGRLLEGIDLTLEHISRDIWERWTDMSHEEQTKTADLLEQWVGKANSCINLPFGEAMLQFSDTQEAESGQTFVPFLCEVRVGQADDDFGDCSSPRNLEENPAVHYFATGGSPPCSPHTRVDPRELNVEYWLAKDGTESVCLPTSQNTTPNSKKDSLKGSLKTTFRSVVINRVWNQNNLSLTFVKEKRKEKMLQKLGMKKGQKSENDFSPVQIANVARLLCSGSGKHYQLSVTVDGSVYKDVRYFQTSAQWQTHIKSFPIASQSISSHA